ncbi:MAG: hypothetical protein J7L15_01640 [Clostridiales bacterium]|nr:hypothetical protein [Clostridiales bacterium]
MKIQLRDLHQHIGANIIITQADISDGIYLIMGIEDYVFELYNIKTQVIENNMLLNAHFSNVDTDNDTKLSQMEDALVLKILSLSNDGYHAEADSERSLFPYLERLNLIKNLRLTSKT